MIKDQHMPLKLFILLLLSGIILSCCGTHDNQHQLKSLEKTPVSTLSFGSGSPTSVRESNPNNNSTTSTYPPNIRTMGFLPQSATFVSTETGWVIGIDPFKCFSSPTCAAIELTQDGGTTWSHPNYKLPEIFTSDSIKGIKFLNSRKGWMYGKFGLFQTNDAGSTWTKVALPSFKSNDSVGDIAVGQDNLYVLEIKDIPCQTNTASPCSFIGQVVSLKLSNESVSDITLVSKVLSYYQLGSGTTIRAYKNWAVVDFGTSSEVYETFDNGITWNQMNVPTCPYSGRSAFTIVNFGSSDIASVCTADFGMYHGPSAIFISHNSGSTFTQIEKQNYGQVFGLICMSSPDQLLIELGGPEIPIVEVISPNHTSQVTVDLHDHGDGSTASDLGMITSQVGYFISEMPILAIDVQNNNYDYMYMTFDGGNSWKKLDLARYSA